MPIKVFVQKNFDNWHPKTHGPRNYLQSFYFAALIQKCGGGKNYPYAEFRNISSRKRTRSSHQESDNNGTSSLSSDNETTPKFDNSFRTNFNAKFDARMKKIC